MTPDIKTSPGLQLNFHSQTTPQQKKVTFEVQENFSSMFLATSGLGEMNDDDEITTGWETDLDVHKILKQQRAEERRKRSETLTSKKK